MGDPAETWCILRTSAGRTLALAASLAAVGFEVWTPKRTFRRTLHAGRKNERKVEIDAPILPTFVFASSDRLQALGVAEAQMVSPHPPFSIFRYWGRIPLVGGQSVSGLREAEQAATEALASERDQDARKEARDIRVALLRTEKARHKAMRSERRNLALGSSVFVDDSTALAGLSGVVIGTDGRSAVVQFGGSLTMTIEAWRLSLDDVDHRAHAA